MISLFWYMAPRWSCANRSVFLERGGEIFQGVHPQGPTCFLQWVGLVLVDGGGSLLFDTGESEVVA